MKVKKDVDDVSFGGLGKPQKKDDAKTGAASSGDVPGGNGSQGSDGGRGEKKKKKKSKMNAFLWYAVWLILGCAATYVMVKFAIVPGYIKCVDVVSNKVNEVSILVESISTDMKIVLGMVAIGLIIAALACCVSCDDNDEDDETSICNRIFEVAGWAKNWLMESCICKRRKKS